MREKIKLLSSAGTGHFYVTTKNKRLHPDKLEVRKFDPVARKHVSYKETEDQIGARAASCPSYPKSRPRGVASSPTGERIRALRVYDARLRWPIDARSCRSSRANESLSRPARQVSAADARARHIDLHLGMSGSLRILPEATPHRSTINSTWCSNRARACD